MNFDPKITKESIMGLLGTKGIGNVFKTHDEYKSNDPAYDWNEAMPLKFDARKQWLRCDMINTIQNQGFCGSSWVGNKNMLQYRFQIVDTNIRALRYRGESRKNRFLYFGAVWGRVQTM